MTTLGQLLANRENAQKSTGPVTDQGKIRAALNRILHGFRGVTVVVNGESEVEYARFKSKMLGELAPQTIEQAEIGEQIVAFMWKRRRLDKMESNLFNLAEQLTGDATQILEKFRAELLLLLRYKNDLRRELRQARADYRLLQTEQKALEKNANERLEQRLQRDLDRAEQTAAAAVEQKKLPPHEAEAHALQGRNSAHQRQAVSRQQHLIEKLDLHCKIFSLCGLGDFTRDEMAAAEGEELIVETADTASSQT